tara:strand:+ start:1965 stop:2225 length:261 start_codon:yes stop_codon:yes gene_type:complete
MANKSTRKQLLGTVHSSKMDKTIVVKITRKVPHKVYNKYVNQSKKYYAHDEKNLCNIGDVVLIEESKPLSKLKRWRVKSVQQKAVK